MKNKLIRTKTIVMLTSLFCMMNYAYSLGFGELLVESGHGQPFMATVELVGEGLSETPQSCFKSRIETIDGGYLGTPKIKYYDDTGRGALSIIFGQPINELAVNLIVDFVCTPKLHRVYQILLSPPVNQVPYILSNKKSDTTSIISQKSKIENFNNFLKDENKSSSANTKPETHIRKFNSRKSPPSEGGSSLGVNGKIDMGNVQSKAGPMPQSKSDSPPLSVAKVDNTGSEMNLKTSKNLSSSSTNTLMVVEQTDSLPSNSIRLPTYHKNLEQVDSKPDRVSDPITPKTTTDSDSQLHNKQVILTKDIASPSSAKQQVVPPVSRPIVSASTNIVDHSSVAEEDFMDFLFSIVVGMGILILGGGGVIFYRFKYKHRNSLEKEGATQQWNAIAKTVLGETQVADDEFDIPKVQKASLKNNDDRKHSSSTSTVSTQNYGNGAKDDLQGENSVSVQDLPLDGGATNQKNKGNGKIKATALKVEEISDVTMEAEFWLSINDTQRALEILEPQSEVDKPDSPVPWLYLLDIYKETHNREKFDALRERFLKIFNAKIPEFDEVASGHAHHIEAFPGLMQRICTIWKTPEIIEFLESLLADDRDGARSGFDLPVYREILMLISVARERKKITDPTEKTKSPSMTMDFESIDFNNLES